MGLYVTRSDLSWIVSLAGIIPVGAAIVFRSLDDSEDRSFYQEYSVLPFPKVVGALSSQRKIR